MLSFLSQIELNARSRPATAGANAKPIHNEDKKKKKGNTRRENKIEEGKKKEWAETTAECEVSNE